MISLPFFLVLGTGLLDTRFGVSQESSMVVSVLLDLSGLDFEHNEHCRESLSEPAWAGKAVSHQNVRKL
jgi:hypothetical protein